MKEKGKERSQFYYTSPAANFASKGLDASQSILIKPSIYIWLPGYVDPGRGWRQAFYTGVFVIFLPWVVPWTAGGNRRITLKSVLDVYRSWAVYHVAAQFWATLYLFRYLLWKYSNMSSCAYERLYMISDWRNMVWF
jgi:hypothetical protein